jgi:hypothetical protein
MGGMHNISLPILWDKMIQNFALSRGAKHTRGLCGNVCRRYAVNMHVRREGFWRQRRASSAGRAAYAVG